MKKSKSGSSTFSDFSKKLIHWDETGNQRVMPWKGIKDPYKIWLSEIILQQTRVDQGLNYYISFTTAYPTIIDLANAPEDEVFRRWQGLGYYNRCRNMMATATLVAEHYNGKFPDTYESILTLKGIGEYTASAIASFAFNLPYAVVDGNVVRVLSRVFALKSSFFDAKGKRDIQSFAQKLLDTSQPGRYNQAIMDLGATICKPQSPLCDQCPFDSICQAYKEQQIELYPIKKEKKALKQRDFHFLVLETVHEMLLTKRIRNDIWKDLHTFFLIESTKITNDDLPPWLKKIALPNPIILSQVLSHQKITGHFYIIQMKNFKTVNEENLFKVKKHDLNKYAFPKLILSFFEKMDYL